MENTLLNKKGISLNFSETLSRKFIHRVLSNLAYGSLQINEGDNTFYFGKQNAEPCANITINRGAFYQKILVSGSIGAAESFINNDWTSTDVTAFIQLFARNIQLLDKIEGYFSWLFLPVNKVTQLLNKNSITGSKKNILQHYDIGNEFYSTFLDASMLYSSAIYANDTMDLAEAQQYKLKTICERLDLQKGQTLLEIGTGWGALAIFAAKHYDVNVTTTTISDAQFNFVKERIAEENLTDKITLLKKDYRELTGKYDRLVSIEMIEAVGHEYMPSFFKKVSELTKSNGRLLIQAITIADQRYEQYRKSIDFIQKYIFPGGCLPSVSVMVNHLKKSSHLMMWSLNDLGQDYAQTLNDWRNNFEHSLTEIKKQGFSEEFIRMWLFYFHYCEAGFLARTTSAVHLVAVGSSYSPSKPQAK